jgi:uncharacterized membrane protein (DUF373 family)
VLPLRPALLRGVKEWAPTKVHDEPEVMVLVHPAAEPFRLHRRGDPAGSGQLMPMPGDTHGTNVPAPSAGSDSGSIWPGHGQSNAAVRLLVNLEHFLLYIVALALLVIGAAVLVVSGASAILRHAPWTERLVTSLEGILLFLIIIEIFVTILTHARGEHIQLEFFIVIGVIALVRHILSIVVRLTIPMSPAAGHQQLWDLAVDAGAAFVLVAALAIARWSARRSDVA